MEFWFLLLGMALGSAAVHFGSEICHAVGRRRTKHQADPTEGILVGWRIVQVEGLKPTYQPVLWAEVPDSGERLSATSPSPGRANGRSR